MMIYTGISAILQPCDLKFRMYKVQTLFYAWQPVEPVDYVLQNNNFLVRVDIVFYLNQSLTPFFLYGSKRGLNPVAENNKRSISRSLPTSLHYIEVLHQTDQD
jgi:hypothetical protein